ncbi:hypothetical protein, partial [Gemmatimonas sp.]|uniref:hypothetical protein n=1 Tax=Gemmatimonas sp. TaxID=1962908 RepID=UPI003341D972
ANSDVWDTLIHGRPSKSIGHIALPDGRVVGLQRRHARMSTLVRSRNDELHLRLESTQGAHLLTGEDAMKAAHRLMPTVNRFGGTKANVQDAVRLLESAGDPLRVWKTVQQQNGWTSGDKRWGGGNWTDGNSSRKYIRKLPGALHTFSVGERLALEMALHEESERRAMEGELHLLETAWREAEEIAKIADAMFTPAAIEARLAEIRRTS